VEIAIGRALLLPDSQLDRRPRSKRFGPLLKGKAKIEISLNKENLVFIRLLLHIFGEDRASFALVGQMFRG